MMFAFDRKCGFRSHASAVKHAASAASGALFLVLHVMMLRTPVSSVVFIALHYVMHVLNTTRLYLVLRAAVGYREKHCWSCHPSCDFHGLASGR